MSGVGDNIAVNLVAEIIWKTVQIGYHVVTNTMLYVEESRQFSTIIQLQIGIWEAISQKLQDPKIEKRIREADLTRFAQGSEELHRLMQKFVLRKCANKEERKKILELHSADELIEKLDEQYILEKLSDKEKEQTWGFWNGLKQELGYMVLKQSKDTKLVTEIVFWGTQLDRFAAAVFPSMFPSIDEENRTQLANVVASTVLKELDSRGQVMLVQSVDSTVTKVGDLELNEAGQFNLQGIAQITLVDREGVPGGFIRPPSPHPYSEQDVAREHANRTDLGGMERRQWGTFTKNGKTSTVIVEFKAKPRPEDARYALGPEFHKGEVDKLIRTLRIASEVKEKDSEKRPFHVLFAEGWYDQHDHFGLVYRLPTLKTANFRCESLGNILLKEEYRELLSMSLENRLVLAKALAWTLFELHSVNWVHESFYPDNILLFAEEVEPDVYHFDWSAPYVVGFDSSHTDNGRSGKFNLNARWTSRIYTHPDRDETQAYKRLKKTYDIYALGVILLEVGRLKSFIDEVVEQQRAMKEFHEKQKKKKEDPDAVQVDIEPVVEFTYRSAPRDLKESFEKKTEALNKILGPVYRQVVMKCLNWRVLHAENDNKLSGVFRSEVCDRLELIKIS
jgi:hypothetical protein